MRSITVIALLCALLVSACTPTTQEVADITDPAAALSEAVDRIRATDTFRILIEQTGTAYQFQVSLDAGASSVTAIMRRGEAQFIVPDELYATVRLEVAPLPAVNTELFAKASDQFFRLAGGSWINFPIAEGFDPSDLVRVDGGFSRALGQLRDLKYLGAETLIDGTVTQHIHGIASGDTINNLMFNLLSLTQNDIEVDVYLDPETKFPLKMVLLLPGSAREGESDTQWNIELYDINAPAEVRAGPDGSPVEAK